MNVKEALDEPRYHHQLIPMNIDYEYGITKVSKHNNYKVLGV